MRTITKLSSALVIALTAAAATAAAQTQGQMQTQQKSTEITVTGCVTQGSQPSVFLLDNARMNANQSQNEPGKRYVLTSKVEDQPLQNLLNHEVTVTGSIGDKDSTLPDAERNLDVLAARTLTSVADRCTPAGK